MTYSMLEEQKAYYHFHDVDFSHTQMTDNEFAKHLGIAGEDLAQFTIYQFELFEEARAFGFISDSTFHLVLFDRNHNVYKRKH